MRFDECVSDDEGHEFLVSLDGYGTARRARGETQPARVGEISGARHDPRRRRQWRDAVKLVDALDDFGRQTVFGNYELSDS
jgi:hypothetical protein